MSMKIKKHNNKKLFYKKYLYKISIDHVLGDIFRGSTPERKNLRSIDHQINHYKDRLAELAKIKSIKNPTISVGKYYKIKYGLDHVRDLSIIRSCIDDLDDYRIRCEYKSKLILYLNDKDKILKKLEKLKSVSHIDFWEPDESIINLQSKDLLVSKLADKYQYKISLNIGSLRIRNPNMLKWIKNNRDKIKISDYALENAYSIAGVYVRDDKVLTLMQMINNNNIKNIERLVLPN